LIIEEFGFILEGMAGFGLQGSAQNKKRPFDLLTTVEAPRSTPQTRTGLGTQSVELDLPAGSPTPEGQAKGLSGSILDRAKQFGESLLPPKTVSVEGDPNALADERALRDFEDRPGRDLQTILTSRRRRGSRRRSSFLTGLS